MIKKLLKPWSLRLFLMRISTKVIILMVFLSTAVIGLSLYGRNVGNFTIQVEEGVIRGLSLSDNNDFVKNARSLLSAPGVKNMTNTTLAKVPLNVDDKDGNNSDYEERQYLAYTFYVKNVSDSALNVQVDMVIVQVFKDSDSALRVMIIKNSSGIKEENIYAKRAKNGLPEAHYFDEKGDPLVRPYETTPFISDTIVCTQKINGMEAGQVIKYTVVMWLEGNDAECIDDIMGGSIRLTMNFAVIR